MGAIRRIGAAAVLTFACAIASQAFAAEGDLTRIDTEPAVNLGEPTDSIVSPDGEHVYVIGEGSVFDGRVTAFDRGANGFLTFIESERDGVDDPGDLGPEVDLSGPRGAAISGDGEHLYVGTDTGGGGVSVFDRDPATGELSFVEFEEVGNITSLAAADATHVIAGADSEDSVFLLGRNATTGEITGVLDQETDGVNDGSDAAGVVDGLNSVEGVAAGGGSVYAAADSDDAIAAFSLTGDELSFVEAEIDGGGGVDGLNGASSVLVAPNGNRVYATGELDNALTVFTRDGGTGALTFVEAERDGVDDDDPAPVPDGLSRAADLAISPDNIHLYVAGASDNALAAFGNNGADGVGFRDVEFDNVDDAGDAGALVDGLAAASTVTISPDGDDVYATGSADQIVAQFARDTAPSSGELAFEASTPQFSLADTSEAVVSGDGAHVYAVSPSTHSVVGFAPQLDGSLAFVDKEADGVNDPTDAGGAVSDLKGVAGIAISPDGAHIYATARQDNAVVEFSRNPSTGKLSYVASDVDGVIDPQSGLTVDGLDEPESLEVSPDGEHVYVAAFGSLTLFERDPATGNLAYVGFESEGQGGVPDDALSGAFDIVIGEAGESIYVSASAGGAVTSFTRDDATGETAFADVEFDDSHTGPMLGPWGLAIGPGEDELYVAGRDSSTLTVLSIGGTDIGYIQTIDGADELVGPAALVVSPDGKQLLVGAGADEILAFDRDLATGELGAETLLDVGVGRPGDLDFFGDHLYVSDESMGELAVFERDPDTTAPKTKITDAPKKRKKTSKKKLKVEIEFESPDDGVDFECRADDGENWKDCRAPSFDKKYKAGNGKYKKYTFSVRATDPSGNRDGSPAKASFKLKRK